MITNRCLHDAVTPVSKLCVRGGGVLVTSGSVAARAEGAADAVRAAGLGLEERRSRGHWVGMMFRKP